MVEITTDGNSFIVEKSLNGLMKAMEILSVGDPWSFTTVEVDDAIVFAGDALKTPFYNFGQSLNPYPEKDLILGTPGSDNVAVNRDGNYYVFTGPGDDRVTVGVERSGEGGGLVIDMGDGFNTLILEQSQGIPGVVMPHFIGEPFAILFGNEIIHTVGVDQVLDDSGAPILPEFPVFM